MVRYVRDFFAFFCKVFNFLNLPKKSGAGELGSKFEFPGFYNNVGALFN